MLEAETASTMVAGGLSFCQSSWLSEILNQCIVHWRIKARILCYYRKVNAILVKCLKWTRC